MKKNKLKHERCQECGLKIRCGDIERHEAGMHHKARAAKKKK